ncbi:PsbP-related protein [Miniphocaeibacter massiliensis]|uniref:PsbP-related protein n=1 Tax=Miniphocaeibacter massiliensis TaxID=2041841 RepID=UPI000C1BBB6B|nr:PsbP-related protein [Miniphocaeibacter massiliensis]
MKKLIFILIFSLFIFAGCESKENTKEDITKEVKDKEVTLKTNEFELEDKNYSIGLPKEFSVDVSNEELFSAEIDPIGIYIYSVSKDDFPTQENVVEEITNELIEDEDFELEKDDITKNSRKIGSFNATELKAYVDNVDILSTAKIYIIDKDEKEFIIISLIGYDSYYEETDTVDKILNSFKVIK